MSDGLPITPNWNGGLTEVREFLTEIFTSRNGREQRIARRNRPRTTVEFSALLNNAGLRALERAKVPGGEQTIGHFVYPRRSLLYPAVAGATEILVDELPDESEICIHAGLKIEYVEWVGSDVITGFDEGYDEGFGPYGFRLILNTPLKYGWARGASVRPVISGRLPLETDVALQTSLTGTTNIRFSVTPGSDIPSKPVTAYSPTIDGVEVFLLRPDWSSTPTATFVSQFETVDYNVGIQKHFTPITFSFRATAFNYGERSHADVMKAVGLFERMRGMAGEFYCPTWTSDLTLAVAASSGATALFVEDPEVAEVYAGDTVRKAILVVRKDGTMLPMKLSSIVSAGVPGQSRLNLSAALTAALQPSDIAMICWLPICRLASDSLTVQWITDQSARFTMNIRALEKL